MPREMCYRCFWPKALCWCPALLPIETRTRFVFLMHPKEHKQEKAGTGRFTHLSLPNSRLIVGAQFHDDPEVDREIHDPRHYPVLLYPGRDALNLSDSGTPGSEKHLRILDLARNLEQRTLVVFLLDGTWSCARKMLRLSPNLGALPRVMFTPERPSRYVIKHQPQEGCLSTLEATHELLLTLDRLSLDRYQRRVQLLGVFERMQAYQMACASDPSRKGYRRSAYKDPIRRASSSKGGHSRRENYLRVARAPEPVTGGGSSVTGSP